MQTTLYQWFDDVVDPIPDNPTAHWRFDDEWDGTTPNQGGGWFESRGDALDDADLNPDFAQTSWTLWIATETTRRKVVNDAYTYTDSGYSLFADFDAQFSESSNGPWSATQSDDDLYTRIRASTGEYVIIPIGDVTEVAWEPLASEIGLYQRGPGLSGSDTYDFPTAIDISQYDSIRIAQRTVKVANGVLQSGGALYDFVLHRPPTGWAVFSPGNNDLQEGMYQFRYDNTIPEGLVIFRMVLSQITVVSGDGRSADIDIPDAVRNDGSEGFNKTAGRFKWIGTSEQNVTGIYLFDNPRNTSTWQQIQWWFYGLGVA